MAESNGPDEELRALEELLFGDSSPAPAGPGVEPAAPRPEESLDALERELFATPPATAIPRATAAPGDPDDADLFAEVDAAARTARRGRTSRSEDDPPEMPQAGELETAVSAAGASAADGFGERPAGAAPGRRSRREERRMRRRRLAWGSTALLVVLLGAGGAYAALGPDGEDNPGTPGIEVRGEHVVRTTSTTSSTTSTTTSTTTTTTDPPPTTS